MFLVFSMRASSELKSFRNTFKLHRHTELRLYLKTLFFFFLLLFSFFLDIIYMLVAVLLCAMCMYDIEWSGNKEIKSNLFNFSIRRGNSFVSFFFVSCLFAAHYSHIVYYFIVHM